MPADFDMQQKDNIEDYIFSFLKDWIMYKWFETKMPDIAAIFKDNCVGNDGYRKDLKSALEKRTKVLTRKHRLW
jgi:hypothetical protein